MAYSAIVGMCILDAHVLMRHHTPKSYFHSRSSSLHPSVLGPRASMPPEVFQNHQRNNTPESSEHPSILFNGWWPKKTVKTLVAHTRSIRAAAARISRPIRDRPLCRRNLVETGDTLPGSRAPLLLIHSLRSCLWQRWACLHPIPPT